MFELLEIKYLSAQIALMIFGMAVIIVWQVVGTVERLHKEQTARTNVLWKQLNELIDQKSSQIIRDVPHVYNIQLKYDRKIKRLENLTWNMSLTSEEHDKCFDEIHRLQKLKRFEVDYYMHAEEHLELAYGKEEYKKLCAQLF